MKLIKYLSSFAVIAILLFAFVVNFSSVESRYQCLGKITAKDVPTPKTAYVKVEQYRWWVGLWGKSDGALWIEIPNENMEYFGDIVRVGDQLQIYDYKKNLKGYFSTLSNTLSVFLGEKTFDGSCKTIEK
jgi:hypothetical protein